MSTLPAVTDATFDERVLAHDDPVLVDVWAEWCPPCRAIGPMLASLAEAGGHDLAFVALDADANPAVVERYATFNLPTLLVFERGQLVRRIVGAKPRAALEADLAAYRSPGDLLSARGRRPPSASAPS